MKARKAIPELSQVDKERFWSKVDKRGEDECWEWRGAGNGNGYGGFYTSNGMIRSHRVSFFLHQGRSPSLDVLHDCDNPKCVNPKHLYEGTHLQNMGDKSKRGRCNVRSGEGHYCKTNPEKILRGERVGVSKLTEEMVKSIRSMEKNGATSRKDMAALFDVSEKNISRVVRFEIWKHVLP